MLEAKEVQFLYDLNGVIIYSHQSREISIPRAPFELPPDPLTSFIVKKSQMYSPVGLDVMRLILAQKQLAELLPKEERACSLSDEFSTFGKAQGFHITDTSIGE